MFPIPLLLLAIAQHITVAYNPKPYRAAVILPLKPKLAVIQRTRWTPPDPAAAAILEADRQFFAAHFQTPLGPVNKSTTFTNQGEDVLLARLSFQTPQPGLRELIIWDDPTFVSYLFRLHPSMIAPTRLQAFLEPTVKWSELAVRLRPGGAGGDYAVPIPFYLFRRPDTGNITGTTETLRANKFLRPFPVANRHLTFELLADSIVATLDVTITKGSGSEFPPSTTRVSERFPPLSERAKKWDLDQLVSKLGPKAHRRQSIMMTSATES
ncbi:MAG TPA: hypothetical protein VGL72_10910 [Bryobacteraceae bacterium]